MKKREKSVNFFFNVQTRILVIGYELIRQTSLTVKTCTTFFFLIYWSLHNTRWITMTNSSPNTIPMHVTLGVEGAQSVQGFTDVLM